MDTKQGSADINGGAISLSTSVDILNGTDDTGNIVIDNGARLDASSGAYVGNSGAIATTSTGLPLGQGGAVSLVAYSAVSGGPIPNYSPATPRGRIEIGDTADITALGFNGGGALTLQTLSIQVGGDKSAMAAYGYYFDPTYWGDRGFGVLNLSSVWDTVIPAGTQVVLTHENLLTPNGATLQGLTSGAKPVELFSAGTLDTYDRSPTDLSVTAGLQLIKYSLSGELLSTNPPTVYGANDVLLGAGASILADPGATISLASYDQVTILGDITAHGGAVDLSIPLDASAWPVVAGQIYLGPQSSIDVSGTIVLNDQAAPVRDPATGLVYMPVPGKIYAGGAVNLTSLWAPILATTGSTINVSGTSGAYDVEQIDTHTGALSYGRQSVWSDAGSVSITGNAALIFEGTLIGNGGGPSAEGGTLSITLKPIQEDLSGPDRLVLIDGLPAALSAAGITFDVNTYTPTVYYNNIQGVQAQGVLPGIAGVMIFDVGVLKNSGFTSLNLSDTGGAIAFTGDVALSLGKSVAMDASSYTVLPNVLNVLNGGAFGGGSTLWTNNDETPSLSITAPYISMGGSSNGGFIPTGYITGSALSLNAGQLLDIASPSLFDIGQATFTSQGDIRLLPQASVTLAGAYLLDAGIYSAGNLTFDADRIYPATNTLFIIQSSATDGTVSFGYPAGGSADSATPLSVGGVLAVDAVNIVQNGDIVAPFGSILLGFTGAQASSSLSHALGTLLPNSSYAVPINDNSLQGVATQSVTLGAGGVTSVSANGATLPYGVTADGTDWSYGAYALTAPPTGLVALGGANVTLASGAKVDVSGGGDVYAQEWVPGIGGSRDVLSQYNTTYASGSTTGIPTPLYADARQVYAIVPGQAESIPYDVAMAGGTAIPIGAAVYLNGSSGVPAGVYALLPAKYATLPGAYRVVLDTSVANVSGSQASYKLPDGTQVISGYFTNTVTGARGPALRQFDVQSASVWGQYSDYQLAGANQYFSGAATANGAQTELPIDAGRVVLNISGSLSVAPGVVVGNAGSFVDTAGATVAGTAAQLDVSASAIEINDTGVSDMADYTAVSAQALEAIGAGSILIGGTRSMTPDGLLITPTASSVVIANDASAPLEAAEIMLVAKPQLQTTSTTLTLDVNGDSMMVTLPSGTGGTVQVNSGAVIRATGAVNDPYSNIMVGADLSQLPVLSGGYTVSDIQASSHNVASGTYTGMEATIAAYYQDLAASMAGFVRLSNGAAVTVQAPTYTQLHPSISVTDDIDQTVARPVTYNLTPITAAGSVSIASGATVAGGNALDIVSLANTRVDAGANLSGAHMLLVGESISVVNSATYGAGGLVVGADTLANIASAQSVTLRSLGAFTFVGDVNLDMTGAGASLTLDAASLGGTGGSVVLAASDVALANSSGGASAFAGGAGTLTVNAGELDFGAGAKTLSGFGDVSLTASNGVVGQGSGSMDFGDLGLTLTTPVVIADANSDQTLTTTGAFAVTAPAAGSGSTALTSSALGGAVTLQGASVTVSAPVQAIAGDITLTATDGAVTVTGPGQLIAHGYAKAFADKVQYASGGAITLSANNDAVDIQSGALVDFSGAAAAGNAGSLSITTSNTSTNVTLAGTFLGSAATGYIGGGLNLNVGGSLSLDAVADLVTGAGINHEILVHTATGDLSLSSGKILTASTVELTADGGMVSIGGVIDASGKAGGVIQLWGQTGVSLTGSLLAKASASDQLGGTVEIGTAATFNPANGYNTAYGYEKIGAGDSGVITLAPTAVIDVSGGTVDGVTGGIVLLRAPLLSDGGVNVTVDGGAQINGSHSTTLEAYAVWSTADATTGTQHFDGIIDPAGWYDSSGVLMPGTFTNYDGTTVASWTGSALTGGSNTLAYYLANDYFTPTAANPDHQTFYGWTNGDDANANVPGTLMGFIQAPGFQTVASTSGIANFVEAPGVELDNPTSAGVNNRAISVLTNWNLGAENAAGVPVFRYNGVAPYITIRAGGNLRIDASISDGFNQNSPTLVAPRTPIYPPPVSEPDYADALSEYEAYLSEYDPSNISYNGLLPDLSALSVQAPATYSALGLSSATTGDQYYQIYENSYLHEYQSFYQEDLQQSSYYFNTPANGGSPTPINVLTDLSTATTLYSSTNLTQYAAYVSAYDVYASDYWFWTFVLSNYASQLPVAPTAPPAVSLPPPTGPVNPTNTSITAANLSNAPDVQASANNAAALSAMSVAAEASSSSYRLVAGAMVRSANPLAVVSNGSGNVTLDGAILVPVEPTSNLYSLPNAEVIAVPTMVRTGVGSIDIAAAGDFELLDSIAPGVVYTAGAVGQTSTTPASIAYGAGAYVTGNFEEGISTLLTAPSNPSGGGDITITVGGDISSVEDVRDTLALGCSRFGGSCTASGLTSENGAFVGQMWSAWLLTSGSNAWYVNFGSFDQGVLSIGGDITVKAGGDISNLSVSTATTGYVTTAANGGESLTVTGGGDLSVTAGGSIYSGAFYEGRGAGVITTGGRIASDFTYVPLSDGTASFDVATLLAVQYGTIDVSARGSVDIGGVFNPTYLLNANYNAAVSCTSIGPCVSLSPDFTSMSTSSGVSIASAGGDIAFNTLLPQADIFSLGGSTTIASVATSAGVADAVTFTSLLMPASLQLTAFTGGISVDHGGGLYPSATGELSLLAAGTISLSNPVQMAYAAISDLPDMVGNIDAWEFGKLDYRVGAGVLPTATDLAIVDVTQLQAKDSIDPSLIVANADPVRVISVSGAIEDGFLVQSATAYGLQSGTLFGGLILTPNAPAKLYAGGDILDLAFYGVNFTANDVTSIVAGGDITYSSAFLASANSHGPTSPTPAIELAGPGSLVVEAGGDIDFPSQRIAGVNESGMRTLGNSLDAGAFSLKYVDSAADLVVGQNFLPPNYGEDFGNPYLPYGGASVTVLAGVGKGTNYMGFASAYLDPATATNSQFLPDFATAVASYEASIGVPQNALSASQAWALYQSFSSDHQQIIARDVLFDVLDQTGTDYNQPSSPYYHQYARGYQAINTLFPASYGYTANSLDGGKQGANTLVPTGSIDMRGSTIQTEQGGDISILAPGGGILVGSSGASPTAKPATEGIITLETGNVSIFTDQSILVAQSRIFTEQGGNLVIWSSNGNIDAGEGAKTTVSFPPPVYTCDLDQYCVVDAKGAVTGAGIATLQSLPDVPPGNADLIAPRGTVDAGAAGIRVSGNLNIAALQVLNAFNISVKGLTFGVPEATTNLTLATTDAATKEAAKVLQDVANQQRRQELDSIVSVEVLGFGGDADQPAVCPTGASQRCGPAHP
ncbi:MAG TPA: filamentous hemagglutinin family protein [Caulobacteraceae bacterium]|nr:filamentous hemagglutinin family protein [Caulobacteraceae bacterium]